MASQAALRCKRFSTHAALLVTSEFLKIFPCLVLTHICLSLGVFNAEIMRFTRLIKMSMSTLRAFYKEESFFFNF